MDILELACSCFKDGRQNEGASPRYIFLRPREGVAHVGLGLHRSIALYRDGFVVQGGSGDTRHPAGADPWETLRSLIDPRHPCFLMVSPDLQRPVADPDLPLILCVQPRVEAQLSSFDGVRPRGTALPPADAGGWTTTPDEDFLQRLAAAIQELKGHDVGKMIMTRAYRKAVGAQDRLRLFELFAASEPAAACSHFAEVGPGIHSLGCSPENILEVDRGRIFFDVVAATRGISPDPAVDKRWLAALQSDPKERREHMMAFDRYKARIESLAQPGSVSIDHQLQVLELGNVRHLYSRLSAALEPGQDWLGLLRASFPPLSSYPAQLERLSDDGTEPRRFYGGVIGRIAPGGQQAAFFLNLRAALVKQGEAHTLGGVGVIAQSEPQKELLEVNNKLGGLMKAVAEWERRS